MQDILQTTAEIAAAFAGFASVVVVFRRQGDVRHDKNTNVTFQSMVLGSLLAVFYSMLPIVLEHVIGSSSDSYYISATLLLAYIVGSFLLGLFQGRSSNSSVIPSFMAGCTIAASQIVGLVGVCAVESMYLLGVFILLSISGYSFYLLITSDSGDQDAA